jgi:hypothetical protein
MLTGFGFFEPYWLIDIANVAVFIHLLGAYQVVIAHSDQICHLNADECMDFVLKALHGLHRWQTAV